MLATLILFLAQPSYASRKVQDCDKTQLSAINAQKYSLTWMTELLVKDIKKATPETGHLIKKWFGKNSVSFRKELTTRLEVTHNLVSSSKAKCVTGSDVVNVYAYVLPSDPTKTINYAPLFFSAPEVGRDSMLGTVLHEFLHFDYPSHAIKGTDDVCIRDKSGKIVYDTTVKPKVCLKAYGVSAARNTAQNHPVNAQDNSDNFQFFLEDYADNLLPKKTNKRRLIWSILP